VAYGFWSPAGRLARDQTARERQLIDSRPVWRRRRTRTFLIGALFFDWPWSRFFWTVGVSIVAKWMLRGFKENQLRVQLEAEQRGELPCRP
jgi:hypothetical protein